MTRACGFHDFLLLREGNTRTALKSILYPLGYGGLGNYPPSHYIPQAVDAIGEVGLQDLGPREPLPAIDNPITLQQGNSVAVALPSDQLSLTAAIEFSQAVIGRQLYSIVLTPERFVAEIAPARTFGFRDQVEQLRQAGLIRGGDLDNALVCDGDRWLNPPLRFADEPVRHKLLDLIGDLALAGLPRAQVIAYRGSHALHTALAAALVYRPHAA